MDNAASPGGRWQIEGGTVLERDKHVANYSGAKRMTCGTRQQNTAQPWLTLFYLEENPAQIVTLHGAHDFNGGQAGCAASANFAAHIGKQFKCVGDTLTFL